MIHLGLLDFALAVLATHAEVAGNEHGHGLINITSPLSTGNRLPKEYLEIPCEAKGWALTVPLHAYICPNHSKANENENK